MKNCGSNVSKHRCDQCGNLTLGDNDITNHISKNHGRNTKCTYCDYETKIFAEIRLHEKKCKNVQERHKCDECNALFSFRRGLKSQKDKNVFHQLNKPKLSF